MGAEELSRRWGVTIQHLHKLLTKEIEKGNGRRKVCVDKPSLYHPLEDDGAIIIDVHAAVVESVQQLNDDGGIGHGPCNSERYKTCLVIRGGA